jgi:hypothetical protein
MPQRRLGVAAARVVASARGLGGGSLARREPVIEARQERGQLGSRGRHGIDDTPPRAAHGATIAAGLLL